MSRIGVSITKSVSFRGATQEFSNVYYYELVESLPTQTQAAAIIDDIVTREKTFHSSVVTFVRGRLWSQQGSPGSNEMIDQHNLSGTGTRSTATSFDRERAYLFRVRAGVDSRGNPVYLRKWYHSCGGGPGGYLATNTVLDQTAAIAGADKTTMETAVAPMLGLTAGSKTGNLVSKSGRPPNSGAQFTSHNYLEHHQLGDMWRAT